MTVTYGQVKLLAQNLVQNIAINSTDFAAIILDAVNFGYDECRKAMRLEDVGFFRKTKQFTLIIDQQDYTSANIEADFANATHIEELDWKRAASNIWSPIHHTNIRSAEWVTLQNSATTAGAIVYRANFARDTKTISFAPIPKSADTVRVIYEKDPGDLPAGTVDSAAVSIEDTLKYPCALFAAGYALTGVNSKQADNYLAQAREMLDTRMVDMAIRMRSEREPVFSTRFRRKRFGRLSRWI